MNHLKSYRIFESNHNSELLMDYFNDLIDSGFANDIQIETEELQPELMPYLIVYHNVNIYWEKVEGINKSGWNEQLGNIIKRIKNSGDFIFQRRTGTAGPHRTVVRFSENDKIYPEK